MDFPENVFLNFHAHQQIPAENEIVIQSKFLHENLIAQKSDKIFFTSGLHPWHADLLSIYEIRKRLEQLVNSNSVIAIGETGIDKLKGPDLEIQLRVFREHVQIAEEKRLPVIVHSVKTHNEILKIKKETSSNVPWVIHNFNGSKQMAFDLIDNGFYLSLSYQIGNNKSRLSNYLKDLPIERLFLETDDYDIRIEELYILTSQKIGIELDVLKKQIVLNLKEFVNE